MKNINPYPSYKPSGIAWLGEIPLHWEVRKLKYSVSINDESLAENTDKSFEFDYIDIESVREGKILERKKMTFESSPSRARRIVKDGDVIVSTVRTYLKAIVQLNNLQNHTIVSTGFAVLRPSNVLYKEFLNYCVRANFFIEKVVANSTGVGYPAITSTRLSNIETIIPPKEEQTAIAHFLDYKLHKIDRFIRKKKQLIGLLNEQKAAIINDAVTKGLDLTVKMKDSGIEWLGDVPEHWEVRKLKYATEVLRGKFTPRPRNDPRYYDGIYPFVQTGNITSTSKYIESYSQTLNRLDVS
jgi:type I restriction enzyme, S subunit